jgi:hypothetical protein
LTASRRYSSHLSANDVDQMRIAMMATEIISRRTVNFIGVALRRM